MIIMFAGLPQSGKSLIVEKIKRNFPDIYIISPKEYRPDDYESLTKEQKTNTDIAAWSTSIEVLRGAFPHKEVNIIYDTCCASLRIMEPIFIEAKRFGHKILYIYCNCSLEVIKSRKHDIDDIMLERYRQNFEHSIPVLSKLADEFIVLNTEKEINLSKLINKINSCK